MFQMFSMLKADSKSLIAPLLTYLMLLIFLSFSLSFNRSILVRIYIALPLLRVISVNINWLPWNSFYKY